MHQRLSKEQLHMLVEATGGAGDVPGFTFSDLTQRLLPAIALDAYPHKPVEGMRAVQIAKAMTATPAFRDEVAAEKVAR